MRLVGGYSLKDRLRLDVALLARWEKLSRYDLDLLLVNMTLGSKIYEKNNEYTVLIHERDGRKWVREGQGEPRVIYLASVEERQQS